MASSAAANREENCAERDHQDGEMQIPPPWQQQQKQSSETAGAPPPPNKQPKRAAEEFQQVIAQRTLADFPVAVVLSQLELGRSFQLLGDKPGAARAYSEVDKTWKGANPGFPPLAQLRTYERELNQNTAF